jgi:hypothetical protein
MSIAAIVSFSTSGAKVSNTYFVHYYFGVVPKVNFCPIHYFAHGILRPVNDVNGLFSAIYVRCMPVEFG